jgi:small subunit ribosomal protein S18
MAKKDQKKKRRIIKEEVVPVNCPFCKTKTSPDYKNFDALGRYMSDRAKVLGKSRTGICAKHQRRISQAIKRARHLGLLPFIPTIR